MHRKSTRKRLTRYGILGINALLLFGVLAFVVMGQSSGSANPQTLLSASTDKKAPTDPLDQVSAADIAANVARMGDLPETTRIVNQADSINTEMSLTQASPSNVAKPLLVATALKSRKDIQTYVVASGDTVSSIAAKFGVTSDSVRWSNNISGNNVNVGAKLVIPPVNGLVYTVKANDTADSLASKFKANKDEIIAANDAEISGLAIGEQILIPNGTQPAPVITAVAPSAGFGWGGTAVYGYNGYDYGWCTWYVANRRAEIGRPVPANLGDAYTWASRAAAAGIPTGSTPQNGAVAVKHSYAPGHVAFVEQVNSDGSFWISEMNSSGQRSMADSTPAGGWGRVDWKLIPSSMVGTYTYVY